MSQITTRCCDWIRSAKRSFSSPPTLSSFSSWISSRRPSGSEYRQPPARKWQGSKVTSSRRRFSKPETKKFNCLLFHNRMKKHTLPSCVVIRYDSSQIYGSINMGGANVFADFLSIACILRTCDLLKKGNENIMKRTLPVRLITPFFPNLASLHLSWVLSCFFRDFQVLEIQLQGIPRTY